MEINVITKVEAPIAKVWECFTNPMHIAKWCFASDDWHAPRAENDLRVEGKFLTRMEAVDGSVGFDFEAVYTDVVPRERIAYTMADGRKVRITFAMLERGTLVTETFDPENENSAEMQRTGWQAILDNFRKHCLACQS